MKKIKFNPQDFWGIKTLREPKEGDTIIVKELHEDDAHYYSKEKYVGRKFRIETIYKNREGWIGGTFMYHDGSDYCVFAKVKLEVVD